MADNKDSQSFMRQSLQADLYPDPPPLEQLAQRLLTLPAIPLPCLSLIDMSNCPTWINPSLGACQGRYDVAKMVANVIEPFQGGAAGQAQMHGNIDNMTTLVMKKTLQLLNFDAVSLGRDVVDDSQTTLENKRPDILLWIQNCLVFRGEEEREKFDKAKHDLKEKMVWNPVLMGALPYVIGAAVTTSAVQFFAIYWYHLVCACNKSHVRVLNS